MSTRIALTLLFGLATVGLCDTKAPARIADASTTIVEGIYFCEGKDSDGDTYTGTVTIHRANSTYVVHWLNGGLLTRGTGLRIGDNLSVGWQSEANGKAIRGVTVYRVASDGKLCGRWVTVPGDGRSHDETLELLRAWPAKEE